MNAALVLLASLAFLGLGYRFYGRRIARLAGVDPSRKTPAHAQRDGVDFVPARRPVLFGHHFASIAAAGPIVGPTLALLYGAGPAWLWIVLGVVFIGAVHDFSSLFVSVREGGRSLAEVTRRLLGPTGFLLFLGFAFLLCVLVSAAFLHLTAIALTSEFPAADLGLAAEGGLVRTVVREGVPHAILGGIASTSVIGITAAAPLIGWLLYRRRARVLPTSLLALGICAASVAIGFEWPLRLDPTAWMGIILAYVVVAAWVPVWIVLQPRDFVNVHFLYLGLLAMIGGILAVGFQGATIDAPATNVAEAAARPSLGLVWPFLFVTIACGAVSGAHGLVCGGTTCKQVDSERDLLPVGYGGMLLEAVLGICVLLVIGAGLGFADYRRIVWPDPGGTSNPALAFALGVGKTLEKGFTLPAVYGTVFGILLLEGFLLTTIDTVLRLSRYLLEELRSTVWSKAPAWTANRLLLTAIPVALTAGLAYSEGYRRIWPIFGSANQLLAALTLVAVTAWMLRAGRPIGFAAIPAAFMVVTTLGALVTLAFRDASAGNWALLATDVVLLALASGVVLLALVSLPRLRAARTAESGLKS